MRIQYNQDLLILREKYDQNPIVIYQDENLTKTNEKVEKKKFIRKCPNGDCRGYLSTALKCDLCENYACKECHETIGKDRKTNHTCLEENVKSVQLLMKDSKACPKCSSLTYKISGCSQIWCTECHTAWDWNTGEIDLGKIHNPHYVEYMNNLDMNNDNIEDNLILKVPKNMRYLRNIARCIIHIDEVERLKFSRRNRLENNLQLRIDFMRNKLTEAEFKKKIQIKDKKNQKFLQIDNLLEMYVVCMKAILCTKKPLLDDYLLEIYNLTKYTNECFVNIGKTFNSKVYTINNKFEFV
jgi:hypothetical protein